MSTLDTIRRGDTYVGTITLTDTELTVDPDNPVPLDLTDKRVTVTCRERIDGPLVYQHYIEIDNAGDVTDSDGLTLVGDAEDGTLAEMFSSTETSGFKLTKAGKSYPFDVEVRSPGFPDVVNTPLQGTHTIVGDITTVE